MPQAAEVDPLLGAAARLAAAGCESPRLDAELLLAEALGSTRTALYLRPARPLPPSEREHFERLIARRAEREPVAYILGRKPFRHLELAVDRGAVALALADERPDLELTGIDISAGALAVARANARRLGLKVSFVRGDLLVGGPYDAVLANLPYVRDGEQLAPEIARFEPPAALYGGADGLDIVRRLAQAARGVPLVALEVGADQAGAAAELLREAGFGDLDRRRDLAGHERVVVARR